MYISKRRQIRLISLTAITGLLYAINLPGQSFKGLGEIPDFRSIRVSGVSADGSVVVGTAIGAGPQSREAFRWTNTGGIDLLGSLSGGTGESWARGVSNDGSIIVGGSSSTNGFEAYRWTSSGGMVGLGSVPGNGSYALSISGDGSTIVGALTQPVVSDAFGGPAFRWTSGSGLELLGTGSGVAYDVSANGSVIVGTNLPSPNSGAAARWTSGGAMVPLGPPPDPILGSAAFAVSGDGETIVGILNSRAALWKTTGDATLLDWASGNSHAEFATDLSYNGSVIIGVANTTVNENLTVLEPFVWTQESGILRLTEALENDSHFSAEVAGWILFEANATSPDGRFISGSGINPDGNFEPWLLDRGVEPLPFLPPSSQAVPEPSTYGLMGVAMLGALIVYHKRQQKKTVTQR